MNQPSKLYQLFATAPKGLELLLVDELRQLGAENPAEKLAGVTFTGDLALAYKACLWSRLANRILLKLTEVRATTPEELYAGVKSIDWRQHIRDEGTLAVHFVSSQSQITHTLFGAQKVKDAIVDQFREKCGTRPSVEKQRPEVSVYVYLHRDVATISLDLSGESLHKRGYRLISGSAPLKENLAAAMLIRAGWPGIAKSGGALFDPMCGSGTLLVEAALMAADIAPGLDRDYFGFLGWKQHQSDTWKALLQEALQRKKSGLQSLPPIVGFDHDPISVRNAFSNIERAQLVGKVHVEKRELQDFAPTASASIGLVITNPPYGERLGEVAALQPLYTLLADRLKAHFVGWKAAVFTGNPELGKQMGLRAKRYYSLFNGAIPCQLLLFEVEPANFIDRSPAAENERRIRAAQKAIAGSDLSAAQMFLNRLRKNKKHRLKEAKRKGDAVCVLYDADLPEYAFQIEVSDEKVVVREYAAPKSIPEEKVLRRRYEVLAALPGELEVEPGKIYFEMLERN